MKGSALEVIVASSGEAAPYNIFVRGPKKGRHHQATRMAAKGWRSVTDIKKDYWPDTERAIRKILQGA
jgi:hypothetical protein